MGSSGEDLPVVDLTATSVEHKIMEKHCSREESSADKSSGEFCGMWNTSNYRFAYPY